MKLIEWRWWCTYRKGKVNWCLSAEGFRQLFLCLLSMYVLWRVIYDFTFWLSGNGLHCSSDFHGCWFPCNNYSAIVLPKLLPMQMSNRSRKDEDLGRTPPPSLRYPFHGRCGGEISFHFFPISEVHTLTRSDVKEKRKDPVEKRKINRKKVS